MMRRMVVRAVLAALVLCLAACSSSGGAAAPLSSVAVAPARVALPRGVSCGHFSDASVVDREAWVGRLLSELDASGEIAVADMVREVPVFTQSVGDLCRGSLASDEAGPLATSLARDALGH